MIDVRDEPGLDRIPPHHLGAEESLLGAMLLSEAAAEDGLEFVDAADFYRPAHAVVFDAMKATRAGGRALEPTAVADTLERSGQLGRAGGLAELVRLQQCTPATANATRYATIVRDHALLRRLIVAAGEVAELGRSGPADADQLVARAEDLIFDVGGRQLRDSVQKPRELLAGLLDRLEALYDAEGTITGVRSGFVDLDEMLYGLQPSALVIVGARPGMGKTAFGLSLARQAALDGEPVLFCSLEMGHLELTQRLIAQHVRVNGRKIADGSLSSEDYSRVSRAVGELEDARLWIDDDPALTVTSLRAKARRVRSREGKIGMIVVDYLQLMSGASGTRSAENRQVEVSEISRGLKVLARELECPVVALSQLSRNLEQRTGEGKRPMLSDLRESGAIEQDADVVMFLYRDDVYHQDSPDADTAEVIVAKHRNGGIGTVRLGWQGQYTRFVDLAGASGGKRGGE